MEIEYMTGAGLEKLKKELADALAAREAQGLLEVKIARLKNKIAGARVIDESQLQTDTVQLLSKVKVENISLKRNMEFTIVGESEADFSKGRLAATTPIGKALIGHSKGDIVEALVPSGTMKFKILEISI